MAIYYIDLVGNDTTGDGSIGNPWRTFAKTSVLVAGDTLYARAGNYGNDGVFGAGIAAFPGRVLGGGTSWANPITISAYPSEVVTIRGFASSNAATQYVIVKDFAMFYANTDVVYLHLANHCRVQNCTVTSNYTHGMGVLLPHEDDSFNEFIDCIFFECGDLTPEAVEQEHGAYCAGSNNVFDGCTFRDNSGYGVQIYNGYVGERCNNNIIKNCRSYGNGVGGGSAAGMDISAGDDNEIYNCIIYDNPRGIDVAWRNPVRSKVYNNTLYNNTGGIFVESTSVGAIIKNNIIWQSGTIVNSGSGTVQSNNLVGIDPLFVTPGSNFYLQTGSPARDTGTTVATVSDDIVGTTRPQNGVYDIGAYEFIVVVTAPSDPTQVCLLVSYALGFGGPNNIPSIGIYATIGIADSLTSGILMRVERCTGTLCSGFSFVGNGVIQYPGTAFAQAEFIDPILLYGTVYRYRVRFENVNGVSGYSTPIEINTTLNGDSICTGGSITDFSDEVRETGNRALYEYTLDQVRATGERNITEYTRDEVRATGERNLTEYLRDEVRVTGLRIIYEFISQVETDLRVTKTVSNPTPLIGENIVWSVLVENVSLVDATNVVVNDIIPVGTDYVSHIASVGTYNHITGIWTIGTLLAGESALLAITATVVATGTHTNTATAISDVPDSNPPDNTDDETIHIGRPPCPGLPLPSSFPEDDADLELQANCDDVL